ncbi:dolichol-phosphate mannosyltransferase subunit 3 [Thamnocephalis sphaerospora]|uniref:Dolichol-phosphate mannosyltransferase subunit 3 n=1 Tax=Thamnocephalis sphaerospora TaxID=78915 RepID=A0A4P9XR63_9FUNG|nr:dolichol-phosphate mannosyltransferase subunit 3 [Thamnocephalis sphaerospora]|eukprot:RKP08556.1 dolichol-phosphate mannosyltransferase subunit 3 [Thamnocephalis sphaerospora]
MTKATQTFGAIGLFMLTWLATLYEKVPGLHLGDKAQTEIVPVLPLVALVWFGAYSLGTVGWNLMTFPECTGAFEELMEEIEQAKNDLRGKVDLAS